MGSRDEQERDEKELGEMPTNRLPLLGVVGLVLTAGLAATSGAVSAPATGSPVSADSALASSKIAFVSEPAQGGYCGTVYVINADGSGQRRLTNGGVPGCGQEWGAAWSPDGRNIAFVGNPMFPPPAGTPYTYDSTIYVMNADGSAQRGLTGTAGFEDSPAWSPDGRKIAFLRLRQSMSELYVVNADGSGELRLIASRAARGLAWSPDARKIAFVGTLGRGRHNMEIYVVNTDGSGRRRLTSNTVGDSHPVWSPDGRRIAFESNWQVWVMNADGSEKRKLTLKGAHNFNPVWSPDGQRIAFEAGGRQVDSYKPGSAGFGVYVMNADGSGQQRLTRGGSQPSWSPHGRKIAYLSKRSGNRDIWIMNADGSGQRNLTRSADRRESGPVWSAARR